MKQATRSWRVLLSGFFCIILFFSCSQDEAPALSSQPTVEGKHFKVFIVMDTIDTWSAPIRDGFEKTLDELLSERHAQAEYTVIDTKLDLKIAAETVERIKLEEPDLCCMINYPSAFADVNISQKLKDSRYRFVSENAVPIQSKTIESMEAPGGNISGVGIYVQMNSALRLLKKLNPQASIVHFYSWDAMTWLNDWFISELRQACEEEGYSMDVKLNPNAEGELAFYKRNEKRSSTEVITGAVSAFVYANGKPADMKMIAKPYINRLGIPLLTYEDDTVALGALLGACVIWYDIGAQLAEKGLRVLQGENPGAIAWEYPRKYNLVINLATAKRLGIEIPENIRNAAYRLYTDYEGNFMGKGN